MLHLFLLFEGETGDGLTFFFFSLRSAKRAPPERGVFLRSRYKKGYRKITFFRYFKGSISEEIILVFEGVRKTPGKTGKKKKRRKTGNSALLKVGSTPPGHRLPDPRAWPETPRLF